jgi:hypothetical protein
MEISKWKMTMESVKVEIRQRFQARCPSYVIPARLDARLAKAGIQVPRIWFWHRQVFVVKISILRFHFSIKKPHLVAGGFRKPKRKKKSSS